jgi:hypothetical protein
MALGGTCGRVAGFHARSPHRFAPRSPACRRRSSRFPERPREQSARHRWSPARPRGRVRPARWFGPVLEFPARYEGARWGLVRRYLHSGSSGAIKGASTPWATGTDGPGARPILVRRVGISSAAPVEQSREITHAPARHGWSRLFSRSPVRGDAMPRWQIAFDRKRRTCRRLAVSPGLPAPRSPRRRPPSPCSSQRRAKGLWRGLCPRRPFKPVKQPHNGCRVPRAAARRQNATAV